MKVTLILIVLSFVALPVGYTFEIDDFNRTLHGGRLAQIAFFIGLIGGAGLGFWLQKKVTDTVGRMRILATCIILSVLFMPLLASLSNRLLRFQKPQPASVEFVEESPRFANRFGLSENMVEPSSYLTFFYKDTELYKIQTPNALFPNAKRGDIVILPIQKGFWGFEFVTK